MVKIHKEGEVSPISGREKLIQDFNQAAEKLLEGQERQFLEFDGQHTVDDREGHRINTPASILYSQDWPDLLNSSSQRGTGLIMEFRGPRGKIGIAIVVEDNSGYAMSFALDQENNPHISEIKPPNRITGEDKKISKPTDPRLATQEQMLKYGIFLLNRLDMIRKGVPLVA